MKTPHEIKLGLERKVLELGTSITGVHSVATEGDTVFAGFDLAADPWVLFCEFERPESVGRDDVRSFAQWLASPNYGDETLH